MSSSPNNIIIANADEIERFACQHSFFEFVKSFWSVVIKEKPVYNWHIPYLCGELQALSKSIVARETKPYDLIINIPPGTTKSTIVTIMFPAWLWTQDASIRIISNSYSMDLSIEHAVKSRDIILSDKFKRLFPEIVVRKDKGAKSMYETTKTGARYTTSTGGTITGKHAHVIINDDPLNPSQAASDADRKSANEHTKTLASRKVNKENTPTILIMQRLHEEDPTGYILKKKGDSIRHICLPAEASDDIKPSELRQYYVNGLLDANRLNQKVLQEAQVDLGSRAYAGQFGQSPFVDGGNIIKKEWFRFVDRETFARMRKNEPIVFFGDTAFTEKSGENDPTGLMATCKIGQDMFITSAVKVYKEFPDLIEFVKTWTKANGYTSASTIRIEPKANGLSVVQQMRRITGLNITNTPSPKDDKTTRLTTASPKVECGRVILVSDLWNEEVIEEVTGFPAKSHDEYVDLIAYAIDYHLNAGTQNNSSYAGYFQ
ncbi:phage terminase large subunit [Spirosoma sp. HMF4905]|uniref:Phage terminase large subunit n=1 Tax=Spirosoma arboris TaxID=2682092 RepID=A0A7K1SIG0_9BACT|nr:phage terminase large subunit [Spirosoma arboris]MVM33609.1 phage terminase large subunit [Spirosoma arboris]